MAGTTTKKTPSKKQFKICEQGTNRWVVFDERHFYRFVGHSRAECQEWVKKQEEKKPNAHPKADELEP